MLEILQRGASSLASSFRYLGKVFGPHQLTIESYAEDVQLVLQGQMYPPETRFGEDGSFFPDYHRMPL